MNSNYHKYVASQTACSAAGGVFSTNTCVMPPPPPPPPEPVYVAPVTVSDSYDGTLTGQLGWSTFGGNCVDEPGVNNPGWGNPIDWPATSATPWIGATVLFSWNHTGVVVGIWSNGDIEVGQENAGGMSHRVPPFMVRGYR